MYTSIHTFAAKKKKTKKDKKAEMDELKQELEMDEHRVPLDELYARLGTNPETVSTMTTAVTFLLLLLLTVKIITKFVFYFRV